MISRDKKKKKRGKKVDSSLYIFDSNIDNQNRKKKKNTPHSLWHDTACQNGPNRALCAPRLMMRDFMEKHGSEKKKGLPIIRTNNQYTWF